MAKSRFQKISATKPDLLFEKDHEPIDIGDEGVRFKDKKRNRPAPNLSLVLIKKDQDASALGNSNDLRLR